MEQNPPPDVTPHEPPSPNVAQAYLDEIGIVEGRREAHINRRGIGWLSLVNAVFLSSFLLLSVIGIRDGATNVSQPLLFFLLIWSQVMQGAAVRSGVQWRFGRRQRLIILATVVYCVLVVLTMGLAIFAADSLPTWFVYVPAGTVLVGLGVQGFVQLWWARGTNPAQRPTPAPLTPLLRAATAALGVVIGGMSAIMGLPQGNLAASLLLLMIALLLVWAFVGRIAGVGIATLAEGWGRSHFVVYGASGVAVFVIAALALQWDHLTPALAGLVGLGIAVLFALVAVLGGRVGR